MVGISFTSFAWNYLILVQSNGNFLLKNEEAWKSEQGDCAEGTIKVSFLSGMASQVVNLNTILLNPGLSGNLHRFSLNLCKQIWSMAF